MFADILLWSGSKKGPPRRLKFPGEEDTAEMIETIKTNLSAPASKTVKKTEPADDEGAKAETTEKKPKRTSKKKAVKADD